MTETKAIYSVDAVLEPYGQCGCERDGSRCFRVPTTPQDARCHPCSVLADRCNGGHGYGAGPLAAAIVTTSASPALPLEQAIRRVVAWEYTLERSDMANVLELQASENGLRVAPPPPVASFSPLLLATLCQCGHERGRHVSDIRCAASVRHPSTGLGEDCPCPGFAARADPTMAPPLYPMAVVCADAACGHERATHAAGGGKCDARLAAADEGRWLACVCLGFRLPVEQTA